MSRQHQHWRKSRRIAERIVIEGELELLTPAHFGGGDTDGVADLSLLRDAYDGSALLPGASITGALRNYWRERTRGYGAPARDNDLFGAKRGAKDEMEGAQSLLIAEDAFGPRSSDDDDYPKPQVELRDGVSIDDSTRTAARGKLFDIELLRADTRFKLRFELLVSEKPPKGMDERTFEKLPRARRDALLKERREELCTNLALALHGFEQEEIGLGARKRRGFGRCRVDEWRVWRYDLNDADALTAWLAEGRAWPDVPPVPEAEGNSLAEKLGVTPDKTDMRHRFEMKADFALEGSLLVRSGFGQADQGPDMEHLHRPRYDESDPDAAEREPVLPGTSLAGALRARALRIANTLAPDRVRAEDLINGLFGVGPEDVEPEEEQDKKSHLASRLIVHEAIVQGVHTLVQNRIRVDRFTGGAMDNYLFSEAPVFGNEGSGLTLELVLCDPNHDRDESGNDKPSYEIGLLLLLLKDLWAGDLALGGESSVGRGRLRGLSATLKYVQKSGTAVWTIIQEEGKLNVTADPEPDDVWQSLEQFVGALNEHLAGR